MSYSETITRTDLTNILNEVLPFSFTEFRNQSGNITVANSTLVQAHSETFTDGSWLILTTLKTLSGGSTTANTGQTELLKMVLWYMLTNHKQMSVLLIQIFTS